MTQNDSVHPRKPRSGRALSDVRPDLTVEWHPTKNGDLTPGEVSYGSGKRVWWKCPVCGHEWEARIYNRAKRNGTGCPVCAGNGTSYPEQAVLFYIGQLFPDAVSRAKIGGWEADVLIPSAGLAIEYDGMRWHHGDVSEEREARKDAEMARNGFRVLRVKEVRERRAGQVDTGHVIFYRPDGRYSELDDAIRRLLTLMGTTTDVDHVRDSMAIQEQYRDVQRHGSLAVVAAAAAAEWHPTKNGDLTPEMFAAHSNRKVWWKCPVCGHEWEAVISSRTDGHGCPVCSGNAVGKGANDFATEHPELVGEWHPTRNDRLRPDMVTAHSGKRVWWKCPVCGHEWEAPVARRSDGHGCPACANKRRGNGMAQVNVAKRNQQR